MQMSVVWCRDRVRVHMETPRMEMNLCSPWPHYAKATQLNASTILEMCVLGHRTGHIATHE